MKTVFMYAGQGSQKVSMGKDFYDEYESFKYFIDRLDLSFDHKSAKYTVCNILLSSSCLDISTDSGHEDQ